MMPGRRRVLGAAVAVLVLAAGCGIPVDDAPRPSQATLGPARSPAVASPSTTGSATAAARIALVDEAGRLVLVPRGAARRDQLGAVAGLLAALTAGPTGTERGGGLSSAIPVGATLRLVALRGGVAHVDIAGDAPDADADRLPVTVGQIVVTVAGGPGVSAVLLTRRGAAVEAPLPDGALSGGLLTARDYASLLRR